MAGLPTGLIVYKAKCHKALGEVLSTKGIILFLLHSNGCCSQQIYSNENLWGELQAKMITLATCKFQIARLNPPVIVWLYAFGLCNVDPRISEMTPICKSGGITTNCKMLHHLFTRYPGKITFHTSPAFFFFASARAASRLQPSPNVESSHLRIKI